MKLRRQDVLAVLITMAVVPAFAVGGGTPGQSVINTIVTWASGIALGVCTLAIIFAGFKVMFMGARMTDLAPIFIGSILIGGASGIALMLMG